MSKIYVDEIAGIASPSTVAIPGHVIQVVQTLVETEQAYTSTSITTTLYSASITPSSTSSKILIGVGFDLRKNNTARDGLLIKLYKDGSARKTFSTWNGYDLDDNHYNHFSNTYLDEPSTTSEITYDIRVRTYGGNNFILNDSNSTGSLILMEIAG